MSHPNEELVRRSYDAFARGDMDTLAGMLADDVVWHVPGRNLISGDHRGVDGVTALLGNVVQLTEGTLRIDLRRVMVDDDGAATVFSASGQRKGRTLEQQNVLVYTIRDGKFTELWQYVQDQYASDDFYS